MALNIKTSFCLLGLLVLVVLPSDAFAQKIYTPAELRKMVAAGKLPAQGKPKLVSQENEFDTCIAAIKNIFSAVGSNYPSKIIANTSIVYNRKIWANDGVTLVTCSKLAGKIVVSISSYI